MASKAAKGRRPSGRDCHARWKSTTTRASPENPDRCPASAPPESEDLVTKLGQTPIIWCVQLDGSSVVGRKGTRRAAGSGHLVGNNAHIPLFPFQLANFPQSPGTPSGLTARTMVRCTGHIACARIAPCRAGAKGPGRAEATPLLRPRPFGRGRLRRGPSLVPATLHLARTTTAARTILSDAGAQDPVYRVHDPSGMRNPVPRNPTYPT